MDGYEATLKLARERSHWTPVVAACLRRVRENPSAAFAGRYILDDVGFWLPGLRSLVARGILRHDRTTRAGRRAYYTMPDPDGVERALGELGVAA